MTGPEPNPFVRKDGENPIRAARVQAARRAGTTLPEPDALERLLVHPRHEEDLSDLGEIAAALAALDDELARGADLPEPDLGGLAECLGGLAVPPVIPDAPLAPPAPPPLPFAAAFVAAILRLPAAR